MAHPLTTQVQALAQPVAQRLGLEVVQVVFHTNQHPPVMRVDIRPLDPEIDTSHADCEAMSQALEMCLDQAELVTHNYVLEVSSPGVGEILLTDRDFAVFKGFLIEIWVDPPHKGKSNWVGNLLGRDQDYVRLSKKGRQIQLPRDIVQRVALREGSEP